MKINLATLALFAAILPGTIFAQNTDKFYSGDKSQPFTEKVKKFNDWSISAGVGVPLIQSADLTSIKKEKVAVNLIRSFQPVLLILQVLHYQILQQAGKLRF